MKTARLFAQGEMTLVTAEQVRDGLYNRNENFVDPEYEFRVVYVKDCKGHVGPYFRLYLSREEYMRLTPERKTQYDILCTQRHYAESPWHREWEGRCSSFCKTEYYVRGLDKTYKRADAFNLNAKTAIEFQHSFIAHDFEERNAFYSRLGLNIIWLYDLTMLDVVAGDDGTYEILENNAKGFYRIAEFPRNLQDYPVFIQARGGAIFRISILDRKEIEDCRKSTIRVFKPDGVYSEEQFIEGIKNPEGLFLSKSFADSIKPKGNSVYDLWNPNFHRMIVNNPVLDMTIMIYAEGKRMNVDNNTGFITYRYVSWDEKTGTYAVKGEKYYQLRDSKARDKNWHLIKAYGKK